MPLEVLLEQKNYISSYSKQNVKDSLEGHCMSVGFLAVSNSNQALHLRPERITRELWGFTEVGGSWQLCGGNALDSGWQEPQLLFYIPQQEQVGHWLSLQLPHLTS